jgi:hypothetical protein
MKFVVSDDVTPRSLVDEYHQEKTLLVQEGMERDLHDHRL